MDNKGNRKEYCLFLTILPLNNAMANCGAKPKGLPGIILYKDAITISKTKLTIIDLSIFICVKVMQQK